MSRFKKSCNAKSDDVTRYLRSDGSGEYASPTLSGKTADGTRLLSHKHARYLATAEGRDSRRITHLTVIAQDGFDPQEVAALSSMRELKSFYRLKGLRIQLIGKGSTSSSQDELMAFTRPSQEWVSSTPFLGYAPVGTAGRLAYLKKTIKRDWRKLAELSPELQDVQLLEAEELTEADLAWNGKPRPYEFQRVRLKDKETGPRPCGVFRLRFSREIHGPLCLGYASHFGLGLFVPRQ